MPAQAGERVPPVVVERALVLGAGSEAQRLVVAGEGGLRAAQARQADALPAELHGRTDPRFGNADLLARALAQEALEVGAKGREARVARGAVLLQTSRDHGHEGRSERRGWLLFVQPAHRVEEAARGVGSASDLGQEGQGAPCRHLVRHDAEAVEVAALVAARRIHELLGRHVGRGAEHGPRHRPAHPLDLRGGRRLGPRRHHSRDAEVGDPHRPVGPEQYVRRLDVAMAADAPRVRVLHAVAELDGPAQRLVEVGGVAVEASLQPRYAARVGGDVLHHQQEPPVLFLHEVGADQVGVAAEGDPQLGFLAEQGARGVVAQPLVADGLQGVEASAPPRRDEVDDAESALPEDLEDAVGIADRVAATVEARQGRRHEGRSGRRGRGQGRGEEEGPKRRRGAEGRRRPSRPPRPPARRTPRPHPCPWRVRRRGTAAPGRKPVCRNPGRR